MSKFDEFLSGQSRRKRPRPRHRRRLLELTILAEMREQGVRVPIAPQKFHIFEAEWCRAGDQSMGDITMTDTESGKERRHQVERYRVLARETTDPLASGLLRDIVSELEADLKELAEDALWSPERRPA
jgi:hypothetical protein